MADLLLAQTFAELDRIGVAWCLLRGGKTVARADDVDILARASDLPAITAALTPMGYLRLPSWGRGTHQFFIAYDIDHDAWVKLDIATELAFGRHFVIRTDASVGVLNRRVQRDGIWVPTADDRFWTLLLHCLLDRHGVPAEYAKQLTQGAHEASPNGDLARWFGANAPTGWSAGRVLDAVRSGTWHDLPAVGASVESASLRRLDADGTLRLLSRTVLRRTTKLLVILHRRGLSVAVLGPDGAGKSTLARGLEDSFFFPVRSVYMGLYGESGGASHRLGLLGRLVGLWSRYLAATYHRARGRLVIYDRYVYDALVGTRGSTPRNRLRRWLIAHACPPPDLVVVLDAPGDVLFDRAQEHDAEVLERQRQGYRELGRRLRGVVVLDGTMSPAILRRTVTALIWGQYIRRSRRA